MDEEAMMAAMGLPTSFGKKAAKKEIQKKQIHSTKIEKRKVEESNLPTMEPNSVEKEEKDEKVNESDLEDDNRVDELPLMSFDNLEGHEKPVTCFSVDPAGSRLVTGGRDNSFKLWDFHSMGASLKPFKSVEPAEGNPIRDVQFSLGGDLMLIAPSTHQLHVYKRDGEELFQCIKGDMYVRDYRKVQGHTSQLTSSRWHPNDKNLFMTSSLDSTIRIWDLNAIQNNKKGSIHCMFVRFSGTVGKTPVTSASYSNDGRYIIAGDSTGGIRIWKSLGSYSGVAEKTIKDAHSNGVPITSVQMALNGLHITSRSMDDTVKLWDIRNLKEPVGVANDMTCFHEEANTIYSPNERYILAGTAVRKDQGPAKIVVFDRHTLNRVREIQVPSSCIRLMWPTKLNQLFAGLGNGQVRVFISEFSHGGITIPLSKGRKKLAVDDYDMYMGGVVASGYLLDPEPEPDEFVVIKKSWTGDRLAKQPELPPDIVRNKHRRSGGMNVTEHLMKTMTKNTTRQEDPREAILKYAEKAKNDPYWIAPAYKKTQDKPVLAEKVYEDEAEYVRDQKKRRRQ
ncbi:WD repeat-containing protein 70 [Boothiomyces sp. JEL0838]|nr:WD repeat-containing protein 70 [Boothiomyces sp. JEL0838]